MQVLSNEEFRELLKVFAKPFPPSTIQWRITYAPKNIKAGEKALCVPYGDKRQFEAVLNRECGPNWETTNVVDLAGKGVAITLTIHGVSRSDVGDYNTGGNPTTTALAQAFKRACTTFNLGRYLYHVFGSGVWAEVEVGGNGKPKISKQGYATLLQTSQEKTAAYETKLEAAFAETLDSPTNDHAEGLESPVEEIGVAVTAAAQQAAAPPPERRAPLDHPVGAASELGGLVVPETFKKAHTLVDGPITTIELLWASDEGRRYLTEFVAKKVVDGKNLGFGDATREWIALHDEEGNLKPEAQELPPATGTVPAHYQAPDPATGETGAATTEVTNLPGLLAALQEAGKTNFDNLGVLYVACQDDLGWTEVPKPHDEAAWATALAHFMEVLP